MKRKVAIYARVSTEHEQQLSALDNQIQYYDEIINKNPDWILVKKYIDEGITGTSVNKRESFKRMMEDAKRGYFDLIVTREVSRFARNIVDALQETRRLKKMGIEVYFTEDNIRTFKDDDGELKLSLMATLAQNESKKTSQRVKAGQMISFKNGVFYGTGNILGYDKIEKNMIVNVEQAKIVKFIFQEYLSGKGTTEIKYEIEQKGWKTSTGLSNWSASYISRVLRNEFYAGTIIYRKSYVADYLEQKVRINYGAVEKVIVEGRHEPLVSKEDFEKVQIMLNSHSEILIDGRRKARGIPETIWSKKLKCSCGSSFNRRVYHSGENGTSYSYQCYRRKNNGSKRTRIKYGLDPNVTCNIKLVPEWKLEKMSVILFDNLFADKSKYIAIASDLIDIILKEDNREKEIREQILDVNSKIEKEKLKEEKLLKMFLENMISDKDYEYYHKKLTEKIDKMTLEKYDLEYKIANLESVENRVKKIKTHMRRLLDFSYEGVNEDLIDEFVDKIIVHEKYFEWKLKNINISLNIAISGRKNSSDASIQILNLD